MQVYNGYFMDGTDIGKRDTPYYASAGIAIETQGYPDAPNQPSFPSILIDKTEKYRHVAEYQFGVDWVWKKEQKYWGYAARMFISQGRTLFYL